MNTVAGKPARSGSILDGSTSQSHFRRASSLKFLARFAPRAEPDLRDYSFHTLPFAEPDAPVALRRSTTRRASVASAS